VTGSSNPQQCGDEGCRHDIELLDIVAGPDWTYVTGWVDGYPLEDARRSTPMVLQVAGTDLEGLRREMWSPEPGDGVKLALSTVLVGWYHEAQRMMQAWPPGG
jgi:hypothetical protein